MTEIVHRLEQIGVVPMVAIERLDRALPLADALLAGGLPVAEITFRTDAAAEVTGRLHEQRPELLIGAGTVLNAAYLAQAGGGGSLRFGAPELDASVVAERRVSFAYRFTPRS